jgi:hypothetical protein
MRNVVPALVLVAASLVSPSLAYAQTAAPPPAGQPAAAAPAPAPPEAPPGSRTSESNTISGFLGLGYDYGFSIGVGLGARYQIAIVPNGFLHHPTIHDELALEPGIDFFHDGYSFAGGGWDYNEITPLVGCLWNVWLNEQFAVYPKIDIGYRIGFWSEHINGMNVGGGHDYVFPVYIQGAAGVVYRLGPVSLRGEVGWDALRIGIGVTL